MRLSSKRRIKLDPVPFESLWDCDLVVDGEYSGGSSGNAGDDPINRLLGVGNMGGFRYRGSIEKGTLQSVCLYSSGDHVDWPDTLDPSVGTFTFFGDNRSPGRELHNTPRKGNLILKAIFEWAALGKKARVNVPPIFVFTKSGIGRGVVFRGVAVPGSPSNRVDDDLVALWRTSGSKRFQNYRAVFTILDIARVDRDWISAIEHGEPLSSSAPEAWTKWVETGIPSPLISEQIGTRSRTDQLPETPRGREVIEATHQYFNHQINDPYAFEKCAVDLWRLVAPSTGEVNLTRPWRDGGRDAVGTYCLGPAGEQLQVDFALEAKCYGITNSVGVREMSRLISRLRHRQFGVFVTTSYFDKQAYAEVHEDQHPVVLMAARDTVQALATAGVYSGRDAVHWLTSRYPSRKV